MFSKAIHNVLAVFPLNARLHFWEQEHALMAWKGRNKERKREGKKKEMGNSRGMQVHYGQQA